MPEGSVAIVCVDFKKFSEFYKRPGIVLCWLVSVPVRIVMFWNEFFFLLQTVTVLAHFITFAYRARTNVQNRCATRA